MNHKKIFCLILMLSICLQNCYVKNYTSNCTKSKTTTSYLKLTSRTNRDTMQLQELKLFVDELCQYLPKKKLETLLDTWAGDNDNAILLIKNINLDTYYYKQNYLTFLSNLSYICFSIPEHTFTKKLKKLLKEHISQNNLIKSLSPDKQKFVYSFEKEYTNDSNIKHFFKQVKSIYREYADINFLRKLEICLKELPDNIMTDELINENLYLYSFYLDFKKNPDLYFRPLHPNHYRGHKILFGKKSKEPTDKLVTKISNPNINFFLYGYLGDHSFSDMYTKNIDYQAALKHGVTKNEALRMQSLKELRWFLEIKDTLVELTKNIRTNRLLFKLGEKFREDINDYNISSQQKFELHTLTDLVNNLKIIKKEIKSDNLENILIAYIEKLKEPKTIVLEPKHETLHTEFRGVEFYLDDKSQEEKNHIYDVVFEKHFDKVYEYFKYERYFNNTENIIKLNTFNVLANLLLKIKMSHSDVYADALNYCSELCPIIEDFIEFIGQNINQRNLNREIVKYYISESKNFRKITNLMLSKFIIELIKNDTYAIIPVENYIKDICKTLRIDSKKIIYQIETDMYEEIFSPYEEILAPTDSDTDLAQILSTSDFKYNFFMLSLTNSDFLDNFLPFIKESLQQEPNLLCIYSKAKRWRQTLLAFLMCYNKIEETQISETIFLNLLNDIQESMDTTTKKENILISYNAKYNTKKICFDIDVLMYYTSTWLQEKHIDTSRTYKDILKNPTIFLYTLNPAKTSPRIRKGLVDFDKDQPFRMLMDVVIESLNNSIEKLDKNSNNYKVLKELIDIELQDISLSEIYTSILLSNDTHIKEFLYRYPEIANYMILNLIPSKTNQNTKKYSYEESCITIEQSIELIKTLADDKFLNIELKDSIIKLIKHIKNLIMKEGITDFAILKPLFSIKNQMVKTELFLALIFLIRESIYILEECVDNKKKCEQDYIKGIETDVVKNKDDIYDIEQKHKQSLKFLRRLIETLKNELKKEWFIYLYKKINNAPSNIANWGGVGYISEDPPLGMNTYTSPSIFNQLLPTQETLKRTSTLELIQSLFTILECYVEDGADINKLDITQTETSIEHNEFINKIKSEYKQLVGKQEKKLKDDFKILKKIKQKYFKSYSKKINSKALGLAKIFSLKKKQKLDSIKNRFKKEIEIRNIVKMFFAA